MDQTGGLWELLFGVTDPSNSAVDFNQVKLESDQNFHMDLSDDLLALLGEQNSPLLAKDVSQLDSIDVNSVNLQDLSNGLDLEALSELSAYLQTAEFQSSSSICSSGSDDGLSSLDNLSAQGSPKSIHSSCSDSGEGDSSCSSAKEELLLSKEEMILLKKEGLSLPKRYPLTKQEERTLKKIRRKIRNKKSAQESRRKKKVYMDQLEDQVKEVTNQNKTLHKRVKELEKENVSLQQQLKTLQNIFGRATRNTKATGTCLMALVLSVALIVSPYTQNSSAEGDKDMTLVGDYAVENVAPARSRILYNLDGPPQDNRLLGIPLAKEGFRMAKNNQELAAVASGGTIRSSSSSVTAGDRIVWKEGSQPQAKKNISITLTSLPHNPRF